MFTRPVIETSMCLAAAAICPVHTEVSGGPRQAGVHVGRQADLDRLLDLLSGVNADCLGSEDVPHGVLSERDPSSPSRAAGGRRGGAGSTSECSVEVCASEF